MNQTKQHQQAKRLTDYIGKRIEDLILDPYVRAEGR